MTLSAIRQKLASLSWLWPFLTVAPVIAYLTWMAWNNRFIQDDAFISFRYAARLRHGEGLTWNAGERVEGFTNFLWTMLIAVALRFNVEVVLASHLMGLACFAGSLYFTYRLTRELTNDDHWISLGVVVLLGYNYTFSAYATGGLETQSQALLFAASGYLMARNTRHHLWSNRRSLIVYSTVLSAAIWTRLDSGLLVLVCGVAGIVGVWRANAPRAERLRNLAALAGPFVVLVGGLFLFKLIYFGDILPNTFYAKASTPGLFTHGKAYLFSFVDHYGLKFLLIALVLAVARAVWTRDWVVLALYTVSALWVLYVMKVGGDFMEYRFVVAVLPLFAALTGWLVRSAPRELLIGVLVWLVLVALDFRESSLTTGAVQDGIGIETIHGLASHVEDPNQAWGDVGQALHRHFDASSNVTIAVMAAGAICYYSELRCIDMLGLNDKWIARKGPTVSERVGHQKGAPLAYLVERGVNLVVHPWMKGDQEEHIDSYYYNELQRYIPIDIPNIPAAAEIIEIPIRPGRTLRVLYLQPNAAIDEVVSQKGWKVWGINHSWRK